MKILLVVFFSVFAICANAQWPKEILAKSGARISIYQPQPESMKGDKIKGRAAFSVLETPESEYIFGVFWYTSTMITDRDSRTLTLESIMVEEIKLPGITDTTKIKNLSKLLETEIPNWEITSTIDEVASTIEMEESFKSEGLKNDPPKIIYASSLSMLVLIDGEPRLQDDENIQMKRIINSPFLIVQNPEDKLFYLYGGQFWYQSSSMTEGYKTLSNLPKKIASLDQQIKKEQSDKPVSQNETAPAIIVSTVPTELIQSAGQANFANISGTNLLYIENSENDIFKHIETQKYYVLISGRWYTAPKLEGNWEYLASDKLPADFAKIPEGSEKDNVLSSVAGTSASQDAIRDAQVPQTAVVDRSTATCTVSYDGEPDFEKIEGTSLELAMNTSSTVIKSGKSYYCVENGVWFVASNAKGPWKVSDERPKEVDQIPPSSEAYNTKYVYIYESTPEVVYVGYTPGYMGCYVYGPTVVYGTGYYYSPWYGPYYYPCPATYGFSMHYNPWTGWSMGFHYSSGWFSFHAYGGGGYWGPPMYRPPYYPPYRGGMYGPQGPRYVHNDVDINIDRSNNVYNNRNDVNTRDVQRGQGSRQQPGVSTNDRQAPQNRQPQVDQQPAGPSKPQNRDVYSDRDGNVYQKNDKGGWDQRQGNEWKQSQQPSNMDRDYENRQRSQQQNNNYQQMNRGGNMGGNYSGSRPTTGSRPSGGGGGRRR